VSAPGDAPTAGDLTLREVLRRTVGPLLAVVLLQLLFALSFIGVFHDPQPRGLPIAVAAPGAQAAAQVLQQLEGNAGDALDPYAVAGEQQARDEVLERDAAAAYVLGTDADVLVIASGGSLAQAELLTETFQAAAARQQRSLTVEDAAPLPEADSRGLNAFYLTLVLVFGGLFGTTVLGQFTSTVPSRGSIAVLRLGGLAAYAAVSATVIVLGANLAFGAQQGHLLLSVLAGVLISAATAAVALGVQSLLGIAGTLVVMVLFVVFGNPASGGPLTYDFLPTAYRALGPYTVNGAGVDLLRAVTYFDSTAVMRPLLVLGAWMTAGALMTVLVSTNRAARTTRQQVQALSPAGLG
jgi:hypothetical protein